jgi:regulatory protein
MRRADGSRVAAREGAFDEAFRLLARRACSEAEMAAHLEHRGFSATVVRGVLGRLRGLGYIADRSYAADRAERLLARGFGSGRLRADLERSGVPEAIAEAVMPAVDDERRRARGILEARFGAVDAMGRSDRAKAYRWLAGRGFAEDVIDGLLGSDDHEG